MGYYAPFPLPAGILTKFKLVKDLVSRVLDLLQSGFVKIHFFIALLLDRAVAGHSGRNA
jgi:hypothetical protein